MIVSLGVLFEGLSIIFCLHYLYGEKVRLDKVTIGLVAIHYLWMMLANYHYINALSALMIHPVIMLYCGKKFGWNVKAILINNILVAIIMSVLQASIMLILGIFLDTENLNTALSALTNALLLVIIITAFRHFNLKKLSEVLQDKERLITYSLIVVLASICIFLLGYRSGASFYVTYYLVFIVSIVLIGFVAVDIGKHKLKVREAEAELRLHKLYEQSYQSLIEDIRARQHEFDNHINTIHSQHFLYDTYEGLVKAQEKYCNEIVKENYYNKLLSKGNPVILSFLYSKFKEAEKRGVVISYRIAIQDLECNVPVYKIVELLGNLLNNAMDALDADDEFNKMSVVMTEYDDRIRIEIANECRGIDYDKLQDFFKKGYSEKGENRGYGLYNVKKICEDYHGELECVIKEIDEHEWLFFEITIGKTVSMKK